MRQLRALALTLIAATLVSAGHLGAREPDREIGDELNEMCAGCHGEFGQGGKQGVNPRQAGQPHPFLVDQLVWFHERKRPNLAMVE